MTLNKLYKENLYTTKHINKCSRKAKPLSLFAASLLCVSLLPVTSLAYATDQDEQLDSDLPEVTEEIILEEAHPQNTGVQEQSSPAASTALAQEEKDDATILATMGSSSFATLRDAFDAAPAGVESTVTLVSDVQNLATRDIAIVRDNQSITLDMAGHSITVAPDFAGRPIQNFGTLTVTGNGVIDSSQASRGFGAIRNDGGSLTIQNGTFKGNVYGDGSAVRNAANAELTINGGYFAATSAVYNNGTAHITAGEFETLSCSACGTPWAYALNNTGGGSVTVTPRNNGDVRVHGTQGALAVVGGAEGTISGGTFFTEPCEAGHRGSTFYALYVSGVATEAATCTITGGEFSTEGKNACVYIDNLDEADNGGAAGKSVVQISGGTFKKGSYGAQLIKFYEANDSNLSISGGSFEGLTQKEIDRYVVGNKVQVNSDGTVLVGSSIPQPPANNPTPSPVPQPTPSPVPGAQYNASATVTPTGATNPTMQAPESATDANPKTLTNVNGGAEDTYGQQLSGEENSATPLAAKQAEQEPPLWPFVLLFGSITVAAAIFLRKVFKASK